MCTKLHIFNWKKFLSVENFYTYNISQKSGKDKASDVAENKVQFASKTDMLIDIGKSRLFGRKNLFTGWFF